jgi:uncharacterized protein YgiM (DUF1202 family)
MKKSHRKDVIIARIIFAVLCLIIIILIIAAVNFIRGKLANTDTEELLMTTEQTNYLPPESENPDLPPVTESTEEVEETIYIWTNDGVNLRKKPNTSSDIIAVLGSGTKLELLDQDKEGWSHVVFDGQKGYVSNDYITGTDPAGE